ncbi:hypothetical protein YC2023_015704 [Brassica napus]
MSRRLSRSDKEKWVAVTPPPTKRLPLRIPANKPRNSLPVKDRKLGIIQRIALQRIEADKRRHDDRRGYRRPNQLPPPTGNVRDDHRQRNTHYSDHRASSRTTQDAASSRHREPHYHGSSFHRSPPRESRRSIREDSRVLSSGVKVQNQDVPIDPLSNPIGPSRSLSSHTPSPRNLRERLDFPPEAGGSGGVSLANSSERRSVLARIGRSSPGNAPPTRGPASFDSARLQEVEIIYDGSAG